VTKNMGTLDRAIRTLIAIAIAVLYFTDRISGTVAIVLGVLAAVFLLTSFVAWCPIYSPLGISTRRVRSAS
jgi:ACR3 family arsenite efflux pump ArsB